jgi:molybdopterin molybdotransferase
MITVEQARETILNRITHLPPEKVFLDQALGRYLAEDIVSGRDIPSWDNSAMDGYAVHTADIPREGVKLNIAYAIPAGSMPQGPFGRGEAVKIMTGAPVPPGADAVVKREDTEELDGAVVIRTVPRKNDHIRFAGEDIRKGDLILGQGTLLQAPQIGILASLRRVMVLCRQRPTVAVIATGDEVADLDEELSANKIASSNSTTLVASIRQLGAVPLYLGIARDTVTDLRLKFAQAMKSDLILTSGGVSMGDYDVVREVMTEGGNAMDFWKVRMKPGRPLAFGSIGGIPAIGLPGNPVSTMVSFDQFARPAILKFMGAGHLTLPRVRARLETGVRGSEERPHYVRGILRQDESELRVAPTGPQGSGILSSMAKGNCYMVIPQGTKTHEKGEYITCEVFSGQW